MAINLYSDEYTSYTFDKVLNEEVTHGNVYSSLKSIGKILKDNELVEDRLNKFHLMMVFVFCITILESHLSFVFLRKILTEEK